MTESAAGTMTFWEHLGELRSRLFKAVLALVVGACIAGYFHQELLGWLSTAYVDAWNQAKLPGAPTLNFLEPTSLFFAYVKLSLVAGFVLALPVMLYQLWAFIAPGLYRREKRLGAAFVVSATALFLVGAAFAWNVAFPIAFEFFLGMSGAVGPVNVHATITIDSFLAFTAQMLLALGLIFDLPVLMAFLSLVGLVTHRHLIRFFRYFVVLAFIVAAVVSPPDVASQFVYAIPMLALYGLSIGICWLITRSKERARAARS